MGFHTAAWTAIRRSRCYKSLQIGTTPFSSTPDCQTLLFVLQFNNCPAYPLGFTVGLWTGNQGKLLTHAVVRVGAFNQGWAGINQVFGQKLGRTVCGFVRQDGGVQLS